MPTAEPELSIVAHRHSDTPRQVHVQNLRVILRSTYFAPRPNQVARISLSLTAENRRARCGRVILAGQSGPFTTDYPESVQFIAT